MNKQFFYEVLKLAAMLAVVGALAFCLTACGSSVESTANEDEPSRFVAVEKSSGWWVVYDKNTGVMYTVNAGGYNAGDFTLLVNAEGKPLLYQAGEG